MFASRTLLEHVFRGLIGTVGLVASGILAPTHAVLSLAMLPVSLVALRGCPMCWTIGLIQTVAGKMRGRTGSKVCLDGNCALEARRSAAR